MARKLLSTCWSFIIEERALFLMCPNCDLLFVCLLFPVSNGNDRTMRRVCVFHIISVCYQFMCLQLPPAISSCHLRAGRAWWPSEGVRVSHLGSGAPLTHTDGKTLGKPTKWGVIISIGALFSSVYHSHLYLLFFEIVVYILFL